VHPVPQEAGVAVEDWPVDQQDGGPARWFHPTHRAGWEQRK